jgi:hypothetical protein
LGVRIGAGNHFFNSGFQATPFLLPAVSAPRSAIAQAQGLHPLGPRTCSAAKLLGAQKKEPAEVQSFGRLNRIGS